METSREYDKRVGTALSSLYDSLLSIRTKSNWDRKMLTCSYMHHRDDYQGSKVPQRTTHDSSAIDYFDTFKSGFVGYLMPRDDDWLAFMLHGRSPMSERGFGVFRDLDMVPNLQKMLERASQLVLTAYSKTNFYKAIDECFTDMLMTGNGYIMAVDDWEEGAVYYRCFDPQEVVVADDSQQNLNVFVRKFHMDAVDVSRTWEQAAIPKVRKVAKLSNAESKDIEMTEAIVPRRYLYDLEKSEYFDFGTTKEFIHLIYCELDQELVSISGYDAMPVHMAVYDHNNSASPYGRGMAEKALDEIIQLDNMSDIRLQMYQKNAHPAWVAPFSMKGTKFSSHPDKVNYVGDMSQRPQPLVDGFDYSKMINDIEAKKAGLRSIMDVDLFKTLLGNNDSRKTAYEVAQLKNESMTLLAIRIGSLLKDVLEPLAKRTLKILSYNGMEKLPSEYGIAMEAFIDSLTVELNSVFVRRLSAYLQLEGIMATQNFLMSVGQMFPDALANIDTDQLVRQGAIASGSPRTMLREVGEVKKIRQTQAQMMQQQRELELQNQQAQTNLANSKALAEAPEAPSDERIMNAIQGR